MAQRPARRRRRRNRWRPGPRGLPLRSAVPSGRHVTVSLRQVPGPFTNAGSGAPVQVGGSLYTSFRAEGLQLVGAGGQPTFPGELDLRPGLPVVKQLVAIDASEGVMEWIIGTNFACVGLDTQPAAGTIAIGYSHAVP